MLYSSMFFIANACIPTEVCSKASVQGEGLCQLVEVNVLPVTMLLADPS